MVLKSSTNLNFPNAIKYHALHAMFTERGRRIFLEPCNLTLTYAVLIRYWHCCHSIAERKSL